MIGQIRFGESGGPVQYIPILIRRIYVRLKTKMTIESTPKRLEEFIAELDEWETQVTRIVKQVVEKKHQYSLIAHQAEWHIRGTIYHCRNVHSYYSSFTHEVSMRAAAGAGVIWMYTQDFQCMLFELYALVNLARISLENLRNYLRPLFKTSFNQLPKSVRDFLNRATDCPVYEMLSQQPIFDYLIDLRDCLVHYRSFATSDNAIVSGEEADISNIIKDDDPVFRPMARANFRRIGKDAIAVNVYLPDKIFEETTHGNKRLARFTYDEKWNLLSMAKCFTKLTTVALLHALKLLLEQEEGVYSYSKAKK